MGPTLNSTVIARVAAGLYGYQLGNATMDEAVAAANWLGSVEELVNVLYARDFAGKTNEEVAAQVVEFLGISGDDEVAEAEMYVTYRLDTAAPGETGATIVDIMNLFAGLTGDATYGGFATAFNQQIQAAVAYAQQDGTADVPVSALPGAPVFTLTAVTAAGADVMRLTGDMDVRIDFTNPANQITGLDLDGDGTIEFDGVERSITGRAANFEIVDAYSRNPLNQRDTANNFLGDIAFDGTGFAGDGTNTDGNIFLGGIGIDRAFGGIGNDFLAGGGVGQDRAAQALDDWIARGGDITNFPGVGDYLSGGRNADFFFAELSGIDATDGGPTLFVDGGNTSDDEPAGVRQSAQDSDWLLLEVSDDDEPVRVELDEIATPAADDDDDVVTRSGEQMDIDDVENLDASGNLYGFLDDVNVQIGARAVDTRDAAGSAVNYGFGSSAQLEVHGSEVGNIIIAGYDNDWVDGNGGDDLLMGGNLQFLLETVAGGVTNPNLAGIVNDGMDELYGDDGDDNIVFETDGGVVDGGADDDTLWLTKYTLGTADADEVTTDGRLRLDLGSQDDELDQDDDAEPGYAGYGGADVPGTADQTNYADSDMRVEVDGMENIDATGLGGIDYLAAGTNDPDLSFTNQQNFWGYDGDLDIRGTSGANALYAGGGNDVIEGRQGNDDLQGGLGTDDFYFALDGDAGDDGSDFGDGVDVIRRKIDADGDGLWDVDEDDNVVWGPDFGEAEELPSTSVLRIVIQKAGGNADGDELDDVVNFVSEIVTGVETAPGDFEPITLNTADIRAARTYEDLVAAINEALDDTEFGEDLTAILDSNGFTIFIEDAQGRTLADTDSEVPGAGVTVNQKANTATENEFVFGPPTPEEVQDRIIYAAYEDRSDNELVDDDSVTGSTISLGSDAYAEDLVIDFAADGTRIAEDQEYTISFRNLTTEDTVTIQVNGVTYSLQVGVALNGEEQVDEDGLGETQAEIQTNFVARLADYINSFMDDDTAAGQISAAAAGNVLTITQVDYDGEETVFMSRPVVTIGQLSGGERATATVTNTSQHEVLLFEVDGRDGVLNRENVLFWGDTREQRAILETAVAAGGLKEGSEAVVINGGIDDLIGVAHNLATNGNLDTNFAVHGDDFLLGGAGDDEILGLSGDDRVQGSLGNDVLDGGGDWYAVLYVGQTKYMPMVLNAYEAEELDADGDVLDIVLIEQSEDGLGTIDGDEFNPYFRDTLIYEQADFTAGVTRFTITLNDYEGLGDDIEFTNGGAGTVGVDANGDGTVEVDNVSTFTNFENIRTASGVGQAVAGEGGGQGRDTLNVAGLSTDAEVGVHYDMTGDDVTGGDVSLIEDPDDDADTDNNVLRQVIKVDGVENVIFGAGDDILEIDETEAAKDNEVTGGLGDDVVIYENDFDDDDDEPTVTIYVSVDGPHGTAGDAGTDEVVMTEGRVGAVVATDTLDGVETIVLDGNTAEGIREDDTLNVEELASGATVNYVTGEVWSDTDGDFDFEDGTLQLTVEGIEEIEFVVADGKDTVVVADSADMSANTRADDTDEDIVIDSFLNYDLLDERGDTPERLSISELRSINGGTDDTADEDDIPQVSNFSLFNFELGTDVDTVDYSNHEGAIVSVVNFNEDDDTQYVIVADEGLITPGTDVDDTADRIDRLVDVERIVASQGESVIDLTNSTQGLQISFSREIIEDAANDRTIHRVQLQNLESDDPLAQQFIEYRDADEDDDVDPFDNAVWNTIEGSDYDELVELTDAETTDDHEFNLRGGENEVNYNELTRSIFLTLNVVDYDDADPANTGLITGEVDFTSGLFLDFIGGTDEITSYSAQNEIAAGSLRVEASQDAEDVVAFETGLEKLFILGEVIDGSDQITVRIGDADALNSIELTGFEFLADSEDDDVYEMADLERVQDNLTFIDNPVDDRDTIKVGDDAIAYDGGPAALTAAADTISLEVLNDVFGMDFDVLDVTMVTDDDLILVADDDDQDNDATLNAADTDYIGPADIDDDGDTEAPRDLDDDVIIGDTDLIVSISGFDALWLTDASIDSAGDEFILDVAADELQDGDGDALFDYDGNGLNFSLVTVGGVTVVVDGNEAVDIVGTDDDDTIVGGGGDDVLEGGDGDDVLDGGSAAEVRAFQLALPLDAAAGAAITVDFNGGLTVTLNEVVAPVVDTDPDLGENLDIAAGSTVDQVGAALVALISANLDEVNAIADLFEDAAGNDVDIVSVSYDSVNDTIVFEFEDGFDVDDADVITFADTDAQMLAGDAGTDATVSEQGSDGGDDTFVYGATAATNGEDTVVGFSVGAGNDVLDFSAFFAASEYGSFDELEGTTATRLTNGAGIDATGDVVRFDNLGDDLTAEDIAAETVAGGALQGAISSVILEFDGTTTGEDVFVWFLDDANGDGDITDDEVALVGTLAEIGDDMGLLDASNVFG